MNTSPKQISLISKSSANGFKAYPFLIKPQWGGFLTFITKAETRSVISDWLNI